MATMSTRLARRLIPEPQRRLAIERVEVFGVAVPLVGGGFRNAYGTKTVQKSAVVRVAAANIHVLNARLDAATPRFLDAKAAIEMACVDLTARALGVPVYTYLGGAVKERLTFNTWIGILSPEDAADEALKWFERGFRSAKIKVGGGIEADRDRVKAVREAVGGAMALR